MWFDDDGLFCSVTKKDGTLDREGLQQTFDYIRKMSGEKKICWLGDVTDAPSANKEARDYAAAETPHLVEALALITNSTFSKLLAELFLIVKKPPYPVKLFMREDEAREWIMQFLK